MSGRIRTVKPEWLEDELLAAASDEARTLSIGLILMADDHGNGRASVAAIAASVWRYQLEREDGANAPEVLAKASRAFRELLALRFIGVWTESGQRYFAIRNWKKHQKVDKPGKPLVPSPPANIFDEKPAESEHSRDSREDVARTSRDTRETLAPDLRPVPVPTTTTATDDPAARGESLIVSGFKTRWQSHRDASGRPLGDIWPGTGKYSLTRWAKWAADDPLRLNRSLDGFFASKDPFVAKSRWAFGTWLSDPQRYVSTRVDPGMGGGESLDDVVAGIPMTRVNR